MIYLAQTSSSRKKKRKLIYMNLMVRMNDDILQSMYSIVSPIYITQFFNKINRR